MINEEITYPNKQTYKTDSANYNIPNYLKKKKYFTFSFSHFITLNPFYCPDLTMWKLGPMFHGKCKIPDRVGSL